MNAKLHRRREPWGLVDAAEIVVADVQGRGRAMVEFGHYVSYSLHIGDVIEVRQTEEFELRHPALRDDERPRRSRPGLIASASATPAISSPRDLVVLLCAGDKSTQGDNIKRAKRLAKELDNGS